MRPAPEVKRAERINMKVGDNIYTPRFCNVQIEAIFLSERLLWDAGYTEPTYNSDNDYVIRGKSVDINHMVFAAAPRKKEYPFV